MVGTIDPHIGLSPTSNHPCWAHIKKPFSKGQRASYYLATLILTISIIWYYLKIKLVFERTLNPNDFFVNMVIIQENRRI